MHQHPPPNTTKLRLLLQQPSRGHRDIYLKPLATTHLTIHNSLHSSALTAHLAAPSAGLTVHLTAHTSLHHPQLSLQTRHYTLSTARLSPHSWVVVHRCRAIHSWVVVGRCRAWKIDSNRRLLLFKLFCGPRNLTMRCSPRDLSSV